MCNQIQLRCHLPKELVESVYSRTIFKVNKEMLFWTFWRRSNFTIFPQMRSQANCFLNVLLISGLKWNKCSPPSICLSVCLSVCFFTIPLFLHFSVLTSIFVSSWSIGRTHGSRLQGPRFKSYRGHSLSFRLGWVLDLARWIAVTYIEFATYSCPIHHYILGPTSWGCFALTFKVSCLN